MTVIVNNKVHIRDNCKELADGKFWQLHKRDFEELSGRRLLTARVMQWKLTDGQNKKKLQNMKLKHVGITVIKQ